MNDRRSMVAAALAAAVSLGGLYALPGVSVVAHIPVAPLTYITVRTWTRDEDLDATIGPASTKEQ